MKMLCFGNVNGFCSVLGESVSLVFESVLV